MINHAIRAVENECAVLGQRRGPCSRRTGWRCASTRMPIGREQRRDRCRERRWCYRRRRSRARHCGHKIERIGMTNKDRARRRLNRMETAIARAKEKASYRDGGVAADYRDAQIIADAG